MVILVGGLSLKFDILIKKIKMKHEKTPLICKGHNTSNIYFFCKNMKYHTIICKRTRALKDFELTEKRTHAQNIIQRLFGETKTMIIHIPTKLLEFFKTFWSFKNHKKWCSYEKKSFFFIKKKINLNNKKTVELLCIILQHDNY